MGRSTGTRLPLCIVCMQLAAAAALAAAVTAAVPNDRRLLDVAPVVPTSADIAAVPVVPAAAAATAPVPSADIPVEGVVQPAQVAANAASEWLGTDLPAPPAYTLVGCFQDGTSFTAPRRLARRLAVHRRKKPGRLSCCSNSLQLDWFWFRFICCSRGYSQRRTSACPHMHLAHQAANTARVLGNSGPCNRDRDKQHAQSTFQS